MYSVKIRNTTKQSYNKNIQLINIDNLNFHNVQFMHLYMDNYEQ